MEVEYVSGAADEDIVSRLFRVQNITRVRLSLVLGLSSLGARGVFSCSTSCCPEYF